MKDQIKSYLQRLNNGETLESVQADFVRECKDVDPSAIMQAEQELLREGTSIEELQRLCDVHSALFHGSATDAQKLHAKRHTGPTALRCCRPDPDLRASPADFYAGKCSTGKADCPREAGSGKNGTINERIIK